MYRRLLCLLILFGASNFRSHELVIYPDSIYDGCLGIVTFRHEGATFVKWDCTHGTMIRQSEITDHFDYGLIRL